VERIIELIYAWIRDDSTRSEFSGSLFYFFFAVNICHTVNDWTEWTTSIILLPSAFLLQVFKPETRPYFIPW